VSTANTDYHYNTSSTDWQSLQHIQHWLAITTTHPALTGNHYNISSTGWQSLQHIQHWLAITTMHPALAGNVSRHVEGNEYFIQHLLMRQPRHRNAHVRHTLLRDYPVLSCIHTFIHKRNEADCGHNPMVLDSSIV